MRETIQYCLKHEVMYTDKCAECIENVGVCYKCKTTENLSHKTKTLLICRPCRNASAKEYKYSRYIKSLIPHNDYIDHIDMEEWNKLAKQTAIKLSKRPDNVKAKTYN